MVDTAAALTTGNFHFVAALAKRYPHCVAKLYAPEDYKPIVLSGIVQRGEESITMDLTVGFQFHLPYLTCNGQATSILIATGPHVTVNTIVGLPFIQATCMIIDLSDNVADMRPLDAYPFPLEYHCAAVHVPIVDEAGAAHLSTVHQHLIKEIEALEQQFAASSFVADTVPTDNAIKRVSFGSRAVGQPMSCLTSEPISAICQDSTLGKHGLFDMPMEYYSDPHSIWEMHDNQCVRFCKHTTSARGYWLYCAREWSFCHYALGSKGIVKLYFYGHRLSAHQAYQPFVCKRQPDQCYIISLYIPRHCNRTQGLAMDTANSTSPIRVAPKPKCSHKMRNVFYDDRRFLDLSNKFDHLLHNIDGGVILCKKKHPQPPLNFDDPTFNYKFNESIHAEKIKSKLLLDHLSSANVAAVLALIKHYWTVFDNRGTFTPI